MRATWKNCFRIGISVFIVFLCIYYWPAAAGACVKIAHTLSPLFVGFATAYVLNVIMSAYEKIYFPRFADKRWVARTRRPICIVASVLTLVAIVAAVVAIVAPELVDCVELLVSSVPSVMSKIGSSEWVQRIFSDDLIQKLESFDWMSYIQKFVDLLTSTLGGAIGVVISAVGSVFSAVATGFVGLIFSVYMLSGKEKLISQCQRTARAFLPRGFIAKLAYMLSVLNDCFKKYIVGQVTEALILGTLCTLGMAIFRFPFAAMIGTLVGFTALIPIAGAYIGAIVGALMILTVSPLKALLFIVFILVLQQLEGNLIYPRVVGNSIGMPGIWVLAAVTVGGGIAGILGMIVGVPLAAAAYRIIGENVRKKERADCDGQGGEQSGTSL